MPAANCTNPVVFDFMHDPDPVTGVARVQLRVELTWDGTSTPPNCDGTVSRIFGGNSGPNTWYGHLPSAKGGPAVYRIDPGASGQITARGTLHNLGLDSRSDVEAIDLNQVPPQAGERLLN